MMRSCRVCFLSRNDVSMSDRVRCTEHVKCEIHIKYVRKTKRKGLAVRCENNIKVDLRSGVRCDVDSLGRSLPHSRCSLIHNSIPS
jgi:hypothetical protein